MNKFINAAGRSALTVLIILLIGYGWAFVEMKIMLKSNPELFGYVFIQVNDSDMMPQLNENDIAIVRKNDSYNTGDKVLILNKDSDFKIRTITFDNTASITVKCDSCSEESENIDKSAVIGKAVSKIAYFGHFINFFKQKWFLITLAIIGFSFVVISQYMHEAPKQIN